MRSFLLPAGVVLLGVVLIVSAPVAAQNAEQLFAGTWVVTGGMYKGKPYESPRGAKYTFGNGNVVRTDKSGKTCKGVFTVDVTRKPQSISIVFADAPKDKLYGVYEIVGNILRINYAGEAAERPTELRTEPDKNWTLLVLARVNE